VSCLIVKIERLFDSARLSKGRITSISRAPEDADSGKNEQIKNKVISKYIIAWRI